MTTETKPVELADQDRAAAAGVMCPLCPEHDPFADETALVNHNNRMLALARQGKGKHLGVIVVDDAAEAAEAAGEPAPVRAEQFADEPTRAEPTVARGLDPAELATIDQVGTASSPLDESPEAILGRQRANGGTFDPVTMRRVVVIGGVVRIRLTAGYDAQKGQEEHLDYWAPGRGWVRDGFVTERGRVGFMPDGSVLVL